MSALSDPTDMLTAILTKECVSMPEEQLHELGYDLEILRSIFTRDVKPNLDYLTGYIPLEAFPEDQLFPDKWRKLLEEHGLTNVKQTLPIVSNRQQYWCLDKPRLYLRIFLTRKGSWILHEREYAYTSSAVTKEVLHEFKNIHTFIEYITTLGMYRTQPLYESEYENVYIPLCVAEGLITRLEISVRRRKEMLRQFKQSTASAKSRLSFVG